MTNNHCIRNQDQAADAKFRFNYQTKSCGTDPQNAGNDLEQSVEYSGAFFIYGSKHRDSTLVTLRTPVDLYQAHGSLALSERQPRRNEESYIIHHPDARPKQITWDDCKIRDIFSISGTVMHNCDTLPGSSGSPIIGKKTGKVLAIHNVASRFGCSFLTRNQGKIISVVARQIRNKAGREVYDDITNHHTIKCKGDNVKIYRVTGKTRRHYPNADIARSWDANFRDHVVTTDCKNLQNGRPMRLKQGAPITCFGNVVKVYRFEGNQRRWYPTEAIANSWDRNWLADKFRMDCSNIPEGPAMAHK